MFQFNALPDGVLGWNGITFGDDEQQAMHAAL